RHADRRRAHAGGLPARDRDRHRRRSRHAAHVPDFGQRSRDGRRRGHDRRGLVSTVNDTAIFDGYDVAFQAGAFLTFPYSAFDPTVAPPGITDCSALPVDLVEDESVGTGVIVSTGVVCIAPT